MNKRSNKVSLLRWGVLGVILIGSMIIHFLHLKSGVKYPSVHAICPYGGLENLWQWISGKANISKLFSGTMVLFFLTVVIAIIFRRGFCGNICPFGALQEFIGHFNPKKVRIPQSYDKYLRMIKYVLLALSVIMAWRTASLWLSPFDPWAAFAHMYNIEELFVEFAVGTIILIITIIASVFISRFFCKYLCPAGALYGIIGKISPMKIECDQNKCTKCGICNKECPMDIDVYNSAKVTSAECIACGKCFDVCPQNNSFITARFGKFKLKSLSIILLSVGIFFGSLFVLDAAGIYRVSLPTVAEVEEKGDYIPLYDIRGSMTIEQGAFYTGKELKEFYRIMEIPEDVPKDTLMKYVYQYVPGYDFHAMKAAKALE